MPYKPIDEIDENYKPVMTEDEFWDTKKKDKEQQTKEAISNSLKDKDKFSAIKKFLNIQ
jgi:hypothetical protein